MVSFLVIVGLLYLYLCSMFWSYILMKSSVMVNYTRWTYLDRWWCLVMSAVPIINLLLAILVCCGERLPRKLDFDWNEEAPW